MTDDEDPPPPASEDPPAPTSSDDERTRARLRDLVPRAEVSASAQYIRRLQTRASLFHEAPQIGRYALGEVLGQGGMGIVVRARHLDFGVDVALKLLDGKVDPDAVDDDERAAWQAHVHDEARKLKQIRGEHVVAVHDVGIVDGLRWLAMAHIDGVDLDKTLTDAPRPIPWRTIVGWFVDAAEGLASIHAAGLVHRDFKPKNAVLERGRNRVCVIDLGLAIEPGQPHPVSATAVRVPHEHAETQQHPGHRPHHTARIVAGTADYMSPEQARGEPVDARSDQFSFCLALYWALHARFPFDGESTAAHVSRTRGRLQLPRPTTPARADTVPRWLHDVLQRGLSHDRDHRFPDMQAVIAELTRDRSRTRAVRVGVLAGSVMIATAAATFTLLPQRQAATCSHNADPDVASFTARRPGLATRLTPEALTALDNFTTTWTDRWTAACTGHFLRGEPTPELRHQCLERQWQDFDRLGEALLTNTVTPANAIEAISELGDPATCDGAGFNRAKPSSPGQQPAIGRARNFMSQARVDMWLGNYDAAQQSADHAVRIAAASDHEPTRAEALHLSGELARRTGKPTRSLQLLAQAREAAIAGRDVFTAIAANHEHVRTAILGQEDLATANASLRLARSHLADIEWATPPNCAPGSDLACFTHARLWAGHEDLVGIVALAELDLERSRDHHTLAIEVLRPFGSEAHWQLAHSLLNRGRALSLMGQRDLANQDYDESKRLVTALYGPNHPELASHTFNLAELARLRGNFAVATEMAERAQALFRSAEGERSAHVAKAEFLLGVIAFDRQDFAQAQRHVEVARTLYAQIGDTSPSEVLRVDHLAAGIAMESDHCVEAARQYTALAGRYATLGDKDSRCDESLARIDASKCMLKTNVDPPAVRSQLVAAEAALVAAGGTEVCPAGYELARTRAELASKENDLVAAVQHLETAAKDPLIPQAVLTEVMWDQARTMVLAGQSRALARRLAQRARDAYAAQGPAGKNQTAVIDSWLAGHM